MKKPFRKADKQKILRVCEVVRKHLGLEHIGAEYAFVAVPDDKSKTTLAASYIYTAGWRLFIEFYDPFFRNTLNQQLQTIVHEHLHVLMQPLDQQINRVEWMIDKKNRNRYHENIYVAREITVDRLTPPLVKLLQPEIDKALR